MSRSVIPILSTVLFDGHTIRSTDLDREIVVEVPTTKAQGKAAISFRPLARLLGHIPADDPVSIEADGTKATVTFGAGSYDLPILPASDFPDERWPSSPAVEIDGEAFRKVLRFLSPFISSEETRYYLNGVHFSRDRDERKTVVATDGHRLGVYPFEYPDALFGQILPRQTVSDLVKMPPVRKLRAGNMRLSFLMDGLALHTKLLDATYPDWRRVVPKMEGDAPSVALDRIGTIAALRRVRATSSHSKTYCNFACDAHAAAICMDEADGLSGRTCGREFLSQAVPRGIELPTCFAVDARYLIGILSAFDTAASVTIRPSADNPIAFEQDGHPGFAILMPARAGNASLALKTLQEWSANRLEAAA